MLTSLAQVDVRGIGVRVGMRRLDDRGKPAAKRNVEDLIHMVGRDELERAAHGRVDLFQILFVFTRDGVFVSAEMTAMQIVMPADGPSFGTAPSGK